MFLSGLAGAGGGVTPIIMNDCIRIALKGGRMAAQEGQLQTGGGEEGAGLCRRTMRRFTGRGNE